MHEGNVSSLNRKKLMHMKGFQTLFPCMCTSDYTI